MYLDYEVKISEFQAWDHPENDPWNNLYLLSYDRKYSSEKHYSVPKNTTIGKCLDASSGDDVSQYKLPKILSGSRTSAGERNICRSACLRIGAFLVIRKIIAGYHLM